MTPEQDVISLAPTSPSSQDTAKSWSLSLDWLAVITAAILAVIVFFGLQVTW